MLTEVSRISEVIITPDYNEEGIYTVRFCIQVGSVFLFLLTFIQYVTDLSLCKKDFFAKSIIST